MMIAIILLCVGIEAVLSLSDAGLIGSGRMRRIFYDYGGFWPGLLEDWRPNYTAQPWVMFLSYGFLHGGLMHLAVNMITLWSLGVVVLDRVRGRGFVMLYVASLLGGGVGYALLAPSLTPMVGASGALFGLAGGILAWSYVDRFTFRERLWPVARAFLLLLLLNVVLWWAMKGHLAWETHLGGFIAGWVAALLIDPRAVKDESTHSTL
ncbi:MAG: rhomboid family intramembrane serine protease, partial [Alphaproteobacteria bacterium]|nr:rhomboid family intramembrane serine protease [Alphaproteobacteria bacterium]